MQALGSGHLGEFELLVLLAVRGLGREASGGAIQLHLSIRARREVALGTIAKTLHRLSAKGFVRSWRGAPRPVPGGRSRIHYAYSHRRTGREPDPPGNRETRQGAVN